MIDWLSVDVARSLLGGAVTTIVITGLTSALSLLLAVGLTGARTVGSRLARFLSGVYIEVFRNVPALIQVIFWAYAVPNLFAADTRRTLFFDNVVVDAVGTATGLPIPYYGVAACIALSLNTSAHLAEVLRAGVESIDQEHHEAARSLGASQSVTYRTILLPVGFRAAFPAISTRLIHNLKNTALVSFVAVPDLFHEMQAAINSTFRATEYLVLVAVMYIGLAAMMTAALGLVDRRLHRGQQSGSMAVSRG